MNKKVLILPLFCLALASCDLEDIFHWTPDEETMIFMALESDLPYFPHHSVDLVTLEDETPAVEIVVAGATAEIFEFTNAILTSEDTFVETAGETINEVTLTKTLDTVTEVVLEAIFDEGSSEITYTGFLTTIIIDPPGPDFSITISDMQGNDSAELTTESVDLQLQITTSPGNKSNSVIWSSLNSEVVSVNSSGLLHVEGLGSTSIKAVSSVDERVSDLFAVSVKEPPLDEFNPNPVGEPVELSVEEVYTAAQNQAITSKGTGYSREYSSVKGIYIGHTDNKIPTITDGTFILQLHSTNDRITNGMSEGAWYEYFGYPSRYIYKPGFEILSFVPLAEPPFPYEEDMEFDSYNTYTAADLYRINREGTDFTHYQKMIYFEGYLVYRIQNNGDPQLGFVDNPNATFPSNNISTGDIRVHNNKDYYVTVPLIENSTAPGDAIRIGIFFMVDLWETAAKTWKVWVFPNTLTVL